jgi:hypothetical protein
MSFVLAGFPGFLSNCLNLDTGLLVAFAYSEDFQNLEKPIGRKPSQIHQTVFHLALSSQRRHQLTVTDEW